MRWSLRILFVSLILTGCATSGPRHLAPSQGAEASITRTGDRATLTVDGHRVVVIYPARGVPREQPWVVIHGDNRRAVDACDAWRNAARMRQRLIICPEFDRRRYPTPWQFPWSVSEEPRQTLEQLVTRIFEQLRWEGDQTYLLYGHGSGAQLALSSALRGETPSARVLVLFNPPYFPIAGEGWVPVGATSQTITMPPVWLLASKDPAPAPRTVTPTSLGGILGQNSLTPLGPWPVAIAIQGRTFAERASWFHQEVNRVDPMLGQRVSLSTLPANTHTTYTVPTALPWLRPSLPDGVTFP